MVKVSRNGSAHDVVVDGGRHGIEANIFGGGSPIVVIEPSFGGAAAEWRSIAETLAAQTTVVTYDRAPYGASSRAAGPQDAGDIAGDLHAVLQALGLSLRSCSSASGWAG